MEENIKVGIAVATTGLIRMETVISLIQTCTLGIPVEAFFAKGMLHSNRLKLVLQCLKTKCTHVLFVDSDMQLQPDSLPRLLEHKKDIISVTYNTKTTPSLSVVKLLGENGERVEGNIPIELFECQSVGFGCTLIDLKIFEFIPMPWFVLGYEEDNVSPMTEDVYFCTKARDAGFTVWCDPTIKTGHIGDYIY